MSKLPKKFPEYLIMHKTLVKKIKELEKRKQDFSRNEIKEIQLKMENYQSELKRIEDMFPDNFFIENNHS
ncbi:MAG: hypothetical protein OEL81_02845 [Nitrosopumilus sp.]|nr:hypothetical protein [Nitrosopumilus sp.]